MDTDVKDKPPAAVNGHAAEALSGPLHHLEAIIIKKNRFVYHDKTLYRVYDKPDHFQLVEAESAAEAFEKSGLKHAVKIQRELFYHYIALDRELMETGDEVTQFDTRLPDGEDRRVLLDAALLAGEAQEQAEPFEELSLRDLFAREEEEVAQNALQEAGPCEQQQSAAEDAESGFGSEPESEPESVPETEQEPAAELSAAEVNALLNAQETS